MRDSRWTQIYLDQDESDGQVYFQIRFVPRFLDTEELGVPHGISFDGQYRTREAAEEVADFYDTFFDKMAEAIKEIG